jgi:ferredoxin
VLDLERSRARPASRIVKKFNAGRIAEVAGLGISVHCRTCLTDCPSGAIDARAKKYVVGGSLT